MSPRPRFIAAGLLLGLSVLFVLAVAASAHSPLFLETAAASAAASSAASASAAVARHCISADPSVPGSAFCVPGTAFVTAVAATATATVRPPPPLLTAAANFNKSSLFTTTALHSPAYHPDDDAEVNATAESSFLLMRSRSSSSQAPHPQSAAAASVAFSPLDLRDSAALTSRWVSDISAPGSGAVKLVRSLARSPVLPTSSESPSSDSDSTGTTADSDTADTDTTNTTEVTLSRHHISRPLSEVTWTFSGLMRDPYFGSLGTMWLVNLVVAGALCIFWFVFCVMRACGTGGKNHATRYHSLCAARGYTITLLVLAGGMCTICAFAWTANVDLSRAIDDVYDSSEIGRAHV